MQTLAAIDVGSNGIRMLVGSVRSQDQVEALKSIRIPVRLGQDVFTDGRIGEHSMQAALDAFLRFQEIAQQFDVQRMRAIGTSAMRESENGRKLIDLVRRKTGIQLEVISAQEESRLIHLAITKVVDLKDKKAMLVDIGGGSIEVAFSHGSRIVSAESYALGTVRLLCRLDDKDGHRSFRALLDEYTEAARRRIKRRIANRRIDLCIGTGGNLEELGSLRRRLLKRSSSDLITQRELKTLTEKMGAMTLEERVEQLDLRPDRADVIVPAAMLLQMIIKEAGVKQIQIPGVGLKEGLLWDMVPQALGPPLPRHEQVWLAATRLGAKYQFEGQHGTRVARTARRLFDQSVSLHGLEEEQRLLLELAGLLHDIGHFVNTLGHEQHGYYLLRNSPLIGLEEHEQELVAQLIRYHRKVAPTTQHQAFKALSQKDRALVSQLCALLRLADSIEISHSSRVQHVQLKEGDDGWELRLIGEGQLLLERWSLEKNKQLFEQVFGVGLKVLD